MRLLKPIISKCPEPGYGVHVWTLEAAWSCRRAGLTPNEAQDEIESRMTRSPQWGEIEDSIAKAYGESLEGGKNLRKSIQTKAVYDPEKLKQVAEKIPEFGVKDLMGKSPISPNTCTPAMFLAHLFQPNETVIVFDDFRSQGEVHWLCPQEGEYLDRTELDQFIYPKPGMGAWFLSNPVTGQPVYLDRLRKHKNPLGRTWRAEENITRFPHLLLESDKAPMDLWIKALVQLPLPIVSVTMSGGDSVHALVRVDAENADQWDASKEKIAPLVVTLGACAPSLSSVRLTRLPGCFRAAKNGWQTLLYLNPSSDGRPIYLMPDSRFSHDEALTDIESGGNCNPSPSLVS